MKRHKVLVIQITEEGGVVTKLASVSQEFKDDHIGNGAEFTELNDEVEQLVKKLKLEYYDDSDRLTIIPFPKSKKVVLFNVEQSETED